MMTLVLILLDRFGLTHTTRASLYLQSSYLYAHLVLIYQYYSQENFLCLGVLNLLQNLRVLLHREEHHKP
uniref:Putative secreted protein n=1 Tax=Xenopsylla cheopis TaxID=163159 RepID=A0A6M2DVM5_XENCH